MDGRVIVVATMSSGEAHVPRPVEGTVIRRRLKMLHTYMGYSRNMGQGEGACLIFANTGKEAKKIGFPTIADWFGSEWIDMAVKRLNKPHLLAEANAEKFAAGKPHVVECPEVCPVCQQWGGELLTNWRRGCENCGGED
jgi:hypothetical protein